MFQTEGLIYTFLLQHRSQKPLKEKYIVIFRTSSVRPKKDGNGCISYQYWPLFSGMQTLQLDAFQILLHGGSYNWLPEKDWLFWNCVKKLRWS